MNAIFRRVRKSLIKFSDKLRGLKTGRRALAAFGFGSLTALAMPPANIFPLLWLSFPALIFLLQGSRNYRDAFIVGWCFAFGSFLFGLYWIAAAMFVDIGRFWWAVPLSAAGLPAFFGIYYGLATMAARKCGLKGLSGAVTLALLWFLAGYVRGHLFSGFPWNLEGYTWTAILPILQITSVIGIYGLTLITLIAACLPAILIEDKRHYPAIVLSGVILLSAFGVWGAWHLSQATPATAPNVRLRLVQPNINQAHKWLASEREANFQHLLDLTSAPAEKPITHVIWPETAATFYLSEDEMHRQMMAKHVPPNGSILTGVVRLSPQPNNRVHYYNSLMVIDEHARIVTSYDKFHLVPYGEFIPLRSFIPIPAVATLGLDFSSGVGPQTLHVESLPPFSPLICYEIIFPGAVIDSHNRPQFLINITNDGWYGRTAGPHQHYAIASVRAIEEGLPLVRVANTGISGVIDAYGRTLAMLDLGKTGFVDADLPFAQPPTFFSQWRELPLWVTFFLILIRIIISRVSLQKLRN